MRALLGFGLLCLIACGIRAQTIDAAQQPCRVVDPEIVGSYKGGCQNGLAEGFGEATGISTYRGDFRAGRKHGKGIKTWPTGDWYDGEFADDRKHGLGRYVWGSLSLFAGEIYSGTYVDDLREGHGTYTWPSGDRYSGPWLRDQPSGPLTPMMIARIVAESAALQSIGRPGVRVCRSVVFGLGNRDIVRGEVVSVKLPFIEVRVVDPGRQVHVVHGILLDHGVIILSRLIDWAPCE